LRPDDLYLVDLIEAAAAIAQYLDGAMTQGSAS
jgi:hypothetical protein